MKKIKTFEQFLAENKNLNEASCEGREKFQGLKYQVWHTAPKGYFIKGDDSESKNIFKGNVTYFDKYDDAKEHAEKEIEGYLEEGVDNNKEVELNEGAVKNIFTNHTNIALDLDHQVNQAQIIRADLIKVIDAKELKAYDKALQKLRVAVLEFSSVFE